MPWWSVRRYSGWRRAEGLDGWAASAQVALVPDGGGEGVGVADEDGGPGGRGGGVLGGVLASGDVDEVAVGPAQVPGRGRPVEEALGVEGGDLLEGPCPPVLRDPRRGRPRPPSSAEGAGEVARERRRARRLGADDDDADRQPGAGGRRQSPPRPDHVGPGGRARHRDLVTIGIDGDVLGAEPARQLVAVGLRREDRVDPRRGRRQPVEQDPPGDGGGEHLDVGGPDRVGVEVHRVGVALADHAHVRLVPVRGGHPRSAGLVGDRLDVVPGDDDGDAVATRRGGVDQAVVPGMRRVELADHQPVGEPTAHWRTIATPAAASAGSPSAVGVSRSARQERRPTTHRARKPTYRIAVSHRPL